MENKALSGPGKVTAHCLRRNRDLALKEVIRISQARWTQGTSSQVFPKFPLQEGTVVEIAVLTKQSPHFPAPLQSREKLWPMGCGVTFKLKHRGAHVRLSALFLLHGNHGGHLMKWKEHLVKAAWTWVTERRTEPLGSHPDL